MPARILVIEDNAANLELMLYLLRRFGHSTLSARDGEEGIELALSNPFDLIVCDIQLPRVDGYEVARRLKSEDATRATPLIAVTALAMVGDREKVLSTGFNGYISKPIDPETFVKEVDSFLTPELRVETPPAAQQPIEEERAAGRGQARARILVVDNLETNQVLARSILEPFGFQVSAAHTFAEALEKARESPPDLILSDIHFPGGGGYQLLSEIKNDPRLNSIPFIFLSATATSEADRTRGMDLGANRFILRPVDPQVLLAEIEDCLNPS